MKPAKAFVYTELQFSVPFEKIDWQPINARIAVQPGFVSKTWLSGTGTNSIGGFYEFETVETALRFTTVFFPAEVGPFGCAWTTRVFDGGPTEAASRELHSPFYH